MTYGNEFYRKLASFDEDMRCLTVAMADVVNKSIEVITLLTDTYIKLFAESTVAELENHDRLYKHDR